eukprot:UN28892
MPATKFYEARPEVTVRKHVQQFNTFHASFTKILGDLMAKFKKSEPFRSIDSQLDYNEYYKQTRHTKPHKKIATKFSKPFFTSTPRGGTPKSESDQMEVEGDSIQTMLKNKPSTYNFLNKPSFSSSYISTSKLNNKPSNVPNVQNKRKNTSPQQGEPSAIRPDIAAKAKAFLNPSKSQNYFSRDGDHNFM